MPRRDQRATEDAWCAYEIRRLSIGKFMLFYTIVEETQTVWVIHAKHVSQLTRREELSAGLEDLAEDDA